MTGVVPLSAHSKGKGVGMTERNKGQEPDIDDHIGDLHFQHEKADLSYHSLQGQDPRYRTDIPSATGISFLHFYSNYIVIIYNLKGLDRFRVYRM